MVRMMLGAVATLAFLCTSAAAETKLIMFEEAGCPWCVQWHKEVGGIYHKTAEGKQAELVVLDIFDPVPEQYTLQSRAHYTPTFVLMEDGKEVGRIEGYPGNDFFWGLLGVMLKKLDAVDESS